MIVTGEFGKSLNYSLISNITCSQTSTEYMLTDCIVVQEECLPACTINIGIRCFGKGSKITIPQSVKDLHVLGAL